MRTAKFTGNTTTQYVVDKNNNVIAEADGNGAATAQTIWGDKPLSRKEGNDYFYYLYNAHGDVIGLMNETGTTPVSTYNYDAWGNILSQTGTSTQPIKYAGEYQDTESGNIYLRARYYDPKIGRFTSLDPVQGSFVAPLTLNRYVYCNNNSIMFTDATGLTMTLKGTTSEKQALFNFLLTLTDGTTDGTHSLYYEINEDTGDWRVFYDKDIAMKRVVSGSLVRRIIDNYLACNISVDNTTGGSSTTKAIDKEAYVKGGISTGANVTIFTDKDSQVLTRGSDGTTQYESMPRYLSLGHELIHTLRLMGGNGKPLNNSYKGTYAYTDTKGKVQTETWYQEELDTTGISYYQGFNYGSGQIMNAWTWYTTENALRDEHGLNRRVRYLID